MIEILGKQFSTDTISRIKLEFLPSLVNCALGSLDFDKPGHSGCKSIRTIKESWIYKHFVESETKDAKERAISATKIAIYVNAVIPINQNLGEGEIESVGNHSVLANGIKLWKNDNGEMIECLELENHGGCEQTRYIPVEHPFFEEVQEQVTKIFQRFEGSEIRSKQLNKYGKSLARTKWGNKLESKWYNAKKVPRSGGQIDDEDLPYKYEMLFVRATHPCYQLKFTA